MTSVPKSFTTLKGSFGICLDSDADTKANCTGNRGNSTTWFSLADVIFEWFSGMVKIAMNHQKLDEARTGAGVCFDGVPCC